MPDPTRIVIIGAGTGGYVAAIRAAQFGATVTLIESAAVGGLCLNWGCIPSKSLLACAELAQKIKKAGEFGITITGSVTYDLALMIERKNRVVAGLVKGVRSLLKTWNVEVIDGRGSLMTPTTVRVVKPDGIEMTVQADAIIISTGTTAPSLPNLVLDGTHLISSREALDLATIPDSLVIVGGGVEGCEFASLFSVLGAKVTIVEMLPRILSTEDEEVSALLTAELKKLGVTILVNTRVKQAAVEGERVTITLADGRAMLPAKVLVSIGRPFNTGGKADTDTLGLHATGIELGPRGEILVNERMETTVPGVYAIGDVTGKAMLAHVASAQGKVAVGNILGRPTTMSYDVIPTGIFTFPEVGRVGLTEQEARQRGMKVKIGKFRPIGLGKAHASGETTGLMKIVTDAATGKIVGAHLVGAHAADLIHEAAVAIQMGATAATLAETIHAHPTMAESMLEAAEDVDGMAIHLARRKVGSV